LRPHRQLGDKKVDVGATRDLQDNVLHGDSTSQVGSRSSMSGSICQGISEEGTITKKADIFEG